MFTINCYCYTPSELRDVLEDVRFTKDQLKDFNALTNEDKSAKMKAMEEAPLTCLLMRPKGSCNKTVVVGHIDLLLKKEYLEKEGVLSSRNPDTIFWVLTNIHSLQSLKEEREFQLEGMKRLFEGRELELTQAYVSAYKKLLDYAKELCPHKAIKDEVDKRAWQKVKELVDTASESVLDTGEKVLVIDTFQGPIGFPEIPEKRKEGRVYWGDVRELGFNLVKLNIGYRKQVFEDLCKPNEDALPTLESLRGIAPNATGELSSEEFIRRMRDME